MAVPIIDKIHDLIASGVIGMFGGSAYYLYLVSKGQQFRLSMFCINLFLAFFIGYITGQFLSPDASYRDGLISISGFSSNLILSALETKGFGIFKKIIQDKEGDPQ